MSTAILHPTAEEFDALITGSTPVLVDFWADWCMPCRMLAPVIEQLSERYIDRVSVAKVNVDDEPELAERYGVQSIPTVLLFNGGQLLDTIIGLHQADFYIQRLDAMEEK